MTMAIRHSQGETPKSMHGRRRRVTGFARFAAASALIVATFGAGTAHAAITYDSSFGGSGSGAGDFSAGESGPDGIAVNETTGDVYVVDTGNNRIEQFDEDGTFIRTWGREVNQTTPGDICPINPGDVCQAGVIGAGKGWFSQPRGIAVDNSGGAANGSVYVQDAGNYRIQRFDANGAFVLMWGKEVNQSTTADICTAASGNTCRAAGPSGNSQLTPKVNSEPGRFGNWLRAPLDPIVAVDRAGYVYVGDPDAVPDTRVQRFTSAGAFVDQMAVPTLTSSANPVFYSIAAGMSNEVVLVDAGLKVFDPTDFSASGLSGHVNRIIGSGVGESLSVDPSNGYYFTLAPPKRCDPHTAAPASTKAIIEYHPEGQEVDCTVPAVPPISSFNGNTGGTAVSTTHKLYVADFAADRVHIFHAPVAELPVVGPETASEITSKKAVIGAPVSANLDDTTFHIEYGPAPCSGNPCASSAESESIGTSTYPKSVQKEITGLSAATTYYYRVVASNGEGSVPGLDHTFTTFAAPEVDSSCDNNLARQQAGAAHLFDCRAYELVSAENQGGYNVESDLVPGQAPFAGYPEAEGRALYAVHDGVVPGAGQPTNRGPDPYVATRDAANARWHTEYVGIPADAPSLAPFDSAITGSDTSLNSFAFGGADGCDPCFEDGSAGIPIHTPDGELEQGMVGSIPVTLPKAAGEVSKHFSDDGTHFLFGSEQQFEPEGNPDNGNVTIYDRDLSTDTTQVVSTLPSGDTIEDGQNVVALDVSSDGSRVLIGDLVSSDSLGNRYWDLYMHVGGSPNSIEIVSGGTGALYDGMTSDGTRVFFTTRAQLEGDTDTSADLYAATIGAGATIERVSTGEVGKGNSDSCDPAANSFNPEDWNTIRGGPTDCSVAAVGGGGGVGKDSGSVYFLSPERLDGSGVDGAPNLFLARPGQQPRFVVTLESSGNSPLKPPKIESIGSFTRPLGAAFDRTDGSTYVYDPADTIPAIAVGSPDAYVQKFDSSGKPDTSFSGDSILGGFFADGAGLLGEFLLGQAISYPTQIAVDNNPASESAGDLYVPEHGGGFLNSGSINKYDSTGAFEYSMPTVDFPSGVAVNPVNGNVYASVLINGAVLVFDDNGNPTGPVSFPVAGNPRGLAVDSNGKVYVANGSSTQIYDGTTGASLGTLDPNPSYGVAVDPGSFADPADDVVYVDLGNQVVAYDSTGSPTSSLLGPGYVTESASLAADQGKLAVSNPGDGNVVVAYPGVPTDREYDSPLVIESVRSPETRNSDVFQTTPSGDDAAFPTVLPLTGFGSAGKYELFHYDAPGDQIECVSCNPTETKPSTDASLAANGLSISEDGRVFFNSGESLSLRDTNSKKDAYEWEGGRIELISTGQSPFDSGLLSVSADGTDAFFFTRETLTENDDNGNVMKLYTARENGGLFIIPPAAKCAAADECHGPGSTQAPPVSLGTLEGSKGNVAAGGCDPSALARRVRILTSKAQALHRRAGHASSPRQAERLRKRSRRYERLAQKAGNAAEKCRQSNRRAK